MQRGSKVKNMPLYVLFVPSKCCNLEQIHSLYPVRVAMCGIYGLCKAVWKFKISKEEKATVFEVIGIFHLLNAICSTYKYPIKLYWALS